MLGMEPEGSDPVENLVDGRGCNEDDRTLHEGFMREALAMVRLLPAIHI